MDFKQKHNIYILSALWIIFIFIALVFFKNILGGEEARVRKFILKGKRAAESKDILTCANMVSMRYSDKYGNDRASLIYAGREASAYYKSIFIQIEEMKIKFNDTKTEADVEIEATVICQTESNNPEKIFQGEKGRFMAKLTKENKSWKLLELEFFEPITILGQNIS
jgi:hypothetical protein